VVLMMQNDLFIGSAPGSAGSALLTQPTPEVEDSNPAGGTLVSQPSALGIQK